MSNPSAQQPTKPRGAATFDQRRFPQAWFLCDVVLGFEHKGIPSGGHAYVSRNEDGWYRVLRHGVAFLVSEGVAARHFKRVRNQAGEAVRVGQQARWDEVWYEAMSESRRRSAA